MVLVISFEAAVGMFLKHSWPQLFLYSEPYKDDALRFRAQLEILQKNQNPKIFFMGSSQTREAIDPMSLTEQIESRTQLKPQILNLGVSGGLTITMLMQLDEVLKRQPDIIIAMPYWQGDYTSFDVTKTKNYIFSFETMLFLAQIYGVKNFFVTFKEYFLGSVLANRMPSYRYRQSLVTIIQRWVLGPERKEPHWFAHGKDEAQEVLEKKVEEKKHILLTRNAHTAIHQAAFRRFVQRINEKGISLIVMEPPWHPMTETLWDSYRPAKQDYDLFMAAMAREAGFVYLRSADLPSFSSEDFIGLPYLNEKGRVKFTAFLSDYLASAVSSLGESPVVTKGELSPDLPLRFKKPLAYPWGNPKSFLKSPETKS